MKVIFKEIIAFYKNPKDLRADDLSLKNNVRYILGVILIDLIFFALIAPMLHYIFTLELIAEDISNIVYKQNTLFYNIIISAVLVPLMEELIFRFPLRYNNFYRYFVSEQKWNYVFKILVYLLPLIFGVVHLSNYENINIFILIALSPVLIGSQLVGGYLYTFLRVKFNFLSAVFCHISWNCILILIFIPINYLESPYEVQKGSYQLYIKQSEYSTGEKQVFTIDSKDNKIYNLSIKEYSINHVLDSLFNIKRNKVDYIIDLKFQCNEGIKKEEFIKVIERYENSK
ncbi:CPBP family intramembrane glutamic endopeptidase [Flavobacterium sp. HSC-61S13]|uniref:CPBP family intramembrane glutamic endopeptidase n=1 Tax=Flavobacterium sp. HSC-61S13 TaxID=2910963 RepID=UPI00209CB71A|nr:CPBP family intramembrane glutamic endopeptidase [Flavobacterium sp. HSC-61S13]MCP1994363.1 membrane protease YdiL (CAAX protease family) [Flavobacterium sp. HSC-61S13]